MKLNRILIPFIILTVPSVVLSYLWVKDKMIIENRHSGLNTNANFFLTGKNYSAAFSQAELDSSFNINKRTLTNIFTGKADMYDGVRLYYIVDTTFVPKIILLRAGINGYSHEGKSNLEDTTFAYVQTLHNQWENINYQNAKKIISSSRFDSPKGYFIGRDTLLGISNLFDQLIIGKRVINGKYYINIIGQDVTKPDMRDGRIQSTHKISKKNTFYTTFYAPSPYMEGDLSYEALTFQSGLSEPEKSILARLYLEAKIIFFGPSGSGGGNSKPCPPFGCN